MKNTVGLFLILLLSFSCSDRGVETISKPISPEVSALLIDIDALEVGLADDLILRSSTIEEVSLIKDYLILMRVLCLRLNQHPMDMIASTELFKLLKKMESFPFSERDSGLFEKMIHGLRVALNKYATYQGLKLEGLEWGLYRFSFLSSIEPFKTIRIYKASGLWVYGRGGGKSFAKVESRGIKSNTWLLSAKLDLRKSKKQSLVITHTVRNPEWENFRVYISSNYDGAEPINSEWEELNIKPARPVQSNQWVNLTSSKLDLSKYAGKIVVLGFQFLASEKSNSVWEIIGLEIKGTGNSITSSMLDISYSPIEEVAP